MGLTRPVGVEGLEESGGAQEQPCGVAATALIDGDLAAQVLDFRGSERIWWTGLDGVQQVHRRVEPAGVTFRSGCGERPLRPTSDVRGQSRRGRQELRRRGESAACLCLTGSTFELGGDRLVEPRSRMRSVPGLPVGIELRIGGLGQCAVHVASRLGCRLLSDRRADQGMSESNTGIELDQPDVLGRIRCGDIDAERLDGAPEQRDVAGGLDRGGQQELSSVGWKRVDPAQKALFDQPGDRRRLGPVEAASQLTGPEGPRQFDQCEWVAARLRDDAVTHLLIDRPRHDSVQQGAGIAVAQGSHSQFVDSREVKMVAGFSHREDQRHVFSHEASADEQERLCGDTIEPVHVVEGAHQWLLLANFGEQGEHGQPDQELARRRPGAQTERRRQGVALRFWQVLHVVEHRCAQLMQPGEGELHLRLDAGQPLDTASGRVLDQIVQQHALTDPRLTAHDQRVPLSRPGSGDAAVQCVTFAPAAAQRCGATLSGHGASYVQRRHGFPGVAASQAARALRGSWDRTRRPSDGSEASPRARATRRRRASAH